jgi:hypothetical protein
MTMSRHRSPIRRCSNRPELVAGSRAIAASSLTLGSTTLTPEILLAMTRTVIANEVKQLLG